MMYLVHPDVGLLLVFLSGVLLWLASTLGPSMRLCSCRPQVAVAANRIMLLRTNEEVVTVYVLNYALLLIWGVCSVMVEVRMLSTDLRVEISVMRYCCQELSAAPRIALPCDLKAVSRFVSHDLAPCMLPTRYFVMTAPCDNIGSAAENVERQSGPCRSRVHLVSSPLTCRQQLEQQAQSPQPFLHTLHWQWA